MDDELDRKSIPLELLIDDGIIIIKDSRRYRILYYGHYYGPDDLLYKDIVNLEQFNSFGIPYKKRFSSS